MPTALSTITLTTKNLMVFMILLDSPVKTCLVSHSLDICQSSVIQTPWGVQFNVTLPVARS